MQPYITTATTTTTTTITTLTTKTTATTTMDSTPLLGIKPDRGLLARLSECGCSKAFVIPSSIAGGGFAVMIVGACLHSSDVALVGGCIAMAGVIALGASNCFCH